MATQPLNEVHVCNLALGRLQQKPISTITNPTSVSEKICANTYHQTRRKTLEAHLWNFATTRVKLAKLTGSPVFEHETLYQLPNDYIRLVRLGETHRALIDYTIEGNNILTTGLNDEQLLMVYIFDFKTVARMRPYFLELLTFELAIAMAPFLKADPDEVTLLEDRDIPHTHTIHTDIPHTHTHHTHRHNTHTHTPYTQTYHTHTHTPYTQT